MCEITHTIERTPKAMRQLLEAVVACQRVEKVRAEIIRTLRDRHDEEERDGPAIRHA